MRQLQTHISQLAELPANPTVDQAVEYMKTSIDILDWNLKRRRVKLAVGQDAFLNNCIPSNNSYVARIDCQGLCPQVLNSIEDNVHHEPFKYKGKQDGR